jgi:homoserine kinase
MPKSQITVKAPATSANLGPGFDVFGLALEQPNDKVTLSLCPTGIKIKVSGKRDLPKQGIRKQRRFSRGGCLWHE